MKLSKRKVVTTLRKEREFLKSHFHVKKMAIFGSFANGVPSNKSDVDIFMEFSRPIGLQFIELVEYLQKKIGRNIDLLTPAGIRSIRFKRVASDIRKSLIYV